MSLENFYDFIKYAYEQGEGSDFVSGMAELKTAAKSLKYVRQAGFEFEKDELLFIDDQDVINKSMVVYRWFNWTKSASKELF